MADGERLFSYAEWKSNDLAFGEKPDGSEYYIRFNGPIPFKTAVDLLMKGFMHKINNEEL